MRKINKDEFRSYTIAGSGWSLLVYTLNNALKQWGNITGDGYTLYGNRPNGTRAILDTK